MAFDGLTVDFETLIDTCQQYIILEGRLGGSHGIGSSTFSAEGCIIWSLLMTISICWHPALRRTAIDLLASSNRVENLWNSNTAAVIGKFIVSIAEEGLVDPTLPADMPPERRTRLLDVDVSAAGPLPVISGRGHLQDSRN